MVLRATLNEHVPFTALARLLGLPCRSQAFPTRTDCPFCGGVRLNVYQDNISGGAWHYCFDCHTSGDMIELAAKAWDMSPQAAVVKLARSGVPVPEDRLSNEELARYVQDHPQRRRRMADLWRRAKEYLSQAHSKPLSYLRDKFRLKGQLSPDRWANGPGLLMGGINVREAELTFGSRGNAGNQRLFVGRGWDDVLVFPYHLAPGRIAGFMFVGREGGEKDRVYKGAGYGGKRSDQNEAGLFGLDTIEKANRMFGQYVFAVDDPLIAMRMQIRHYAGSSLSLPLVSWHDQGIYATRQAWHAVERNQVIFWGFHPTPSMIHQASLCDGYLAIVPLFDRTRHRIEHYIRLAPPRDLFRRAIKRALPWKQALALWVKQQGVGPVEELLINLERYGMDTKSLAGEIGYSVEEVVDAPRIRTLQMGTVTIIDREEGWYYVSRTVKRETLLAEAKLRIDEIVVGDDPMYRGVIRYLGEDVPFACTFAELEDDAKRIVVEACVRAGLGRPRFLHGGWKYNLVELAMALHQPKTVAPCPDKPERRA